ncbi:unnamed protein product [Coffea canephora]|uniref:Uncharacterized protein n=1 Tax=Coffea canephora TaxID=49390 RepID=A0A068UH29_COFCA|nr:unnamed protein product [Coffea canephora]
MKDFETAGLPLPYILVKSYALLSDPTCNLPSEVISYLWKDVWWQLTITKKRIERKISAVK